MRPVCGLFPVLRQGSGRYRKRGGKVPKWRADGKEVCYLAPGRDGIMAAGIGISGAGVQVETPHQLFAIPFAPGDSITFPYDVTADGQRFLVVRPANAQPGSEPLTVVLNWRAGLKKQGEQTATLKTYGSSVDS